MARSRGNTVGIRDQAMDIAKLNGHSVSRAEKNLMPTPTTRDYKDGQEAHTRNGKVQTDTVGRAVLNSGEIEVFSTPTTMDAKATNTPDIAQKFLDQGRQTCLTYEVLLGTPRSSSANGATAKEVAAGAPKARLEDQVHTNWGRFEPAIRRWEEVLGRPAPLPTKPDGKDGAHRLSSAFTEWMMGVPEGWITDVGLSRNEELKACGNGVVPQQAELALRILLQGEGDKAELLPVHLPTPTVSDIYTAELKSSQQSPGSMHSVTLPQAVQMVAKTGLGEG